MEVYSRETVEGWFINATQGGGVINATTGSGERGFSADRFTERSFTIELICN